jgi:hypothetical protein
VDDFEILRANVRDRILYGLDKIDVLTICEGERTADVIVSLLTTVEKLKYTAGVSSGMVNVELCDVLGVISK